jgi:UDP-2,3-diacylglucosamine pyrophosphatase LpxH
VDIAWCIADPHFGSGDPALETFDLFLKGFLDSGAGTLVLLGDLFRVWLARPRPRGEAEADVLISLDLLREKGRRVVYILGNRDYFLERLPPGTFDVLSERWDLETPTGRVRFEHGDLINTSDRNYMRWRRFSRSGAVSLLFRALPEALQMRAAGRLERALDSTNRPYKEYRPEAELAAWAAKLRAEGFGGAVLGHFHRDAEEVVEGLRVRLLPQFREDGAHLRIREDGSWVLARVAAPGAGDGTKP